MVELNEAAIAGLSFLGRKCGSHGAGVQREAERGHRVP